MLSLRFALLSASAKHSSRKTPGKRSTLLLLQWVNILLNSSDKTQRRIQEAEEPIQLPAQAAAGKGAEAAALLTAPEAGSTLLILEVCKDFILAYRQAAASQRTLGQHLCIN